MNNLKIIDLQVDTPIEKIEKILSAYEYIHSYPLDYRTMDGMVKVCRYFLREKAKASTKKVDKND